MFKANRSTALPSVLCQGVGGPMLTLNVRSSASALGAVQFHLDILRAGPCAGLSGPKE